LSRQSIQRDAKTMDARVKPAHHRPECCTLSVVMTGLVPAIHGLLSARKTWMPATSAGMTPE
jgi:hypothetical protein